MRERKRAEKEARKTKEREGVRERQESKRKRQSGGNATKCLSSVRITQIVRRKFQETASDGRVSRQKQLCEVSM